jgi:hypothetical protein
MSPTILPHAAASLDIKIQIERFRAGFLERGLSGVRGLHDLFVRIFQIERAQQTISVVRFTPFIRSAALRAAVKR